jgi:hypothetical protein
LAKPYHPIFLDVLETAVNTIEEYRDQGVKEGWSEVVSAIQHERVERVERRWSEIPSYSYPYSWFFTIAIRVCILHCPIPTFVLYYPAPRLYS